MEDLDDELNEGLNEAVDAIQDEARKLTDKLIWDCMDLWMDGMSIPQIRKLMADKGVKTRKINSVCQRLEELIAEVRLSQKQTDFEDHITRGWALFQNASDDKVRFDIWRRIGEMRGFGESTVKMKGKLKIVPTKITPPKE